jgi:2-oxoisovalerate dehydrogenase E1 component
MFGGLGGEISAWISEYCFERLDAPILRCAGLDTPIPFNIDLEQNYLAKSRLGECIERLMSY